MTFSLPKKIKEDVIESQRSKTRFLQKGLDIMPQRGYTTKLGKTGREWGISGGKVSQGLRFIGLRAVDVRTGGKEESMPEEGGSRGI